MCGDYNINILKSDKSTILFENTLSNYNLKLKIRNPTRPSSGTCLDNFAINIRGTKSCTIDLGLSDHNAIILNCPIKKNCQKTFWNVKRRDYSVENLEKFKNYLYSFSFTDIYKSENPNDAFNNFDDFFSLIYKLCFPLKIVKLSNKRKPQWVSKGIKTCCKKKREMLWRHRLRPSALSKAELKAYSFRLKKIIKMTQQVQNRQHIKNSSNKNRAAWQIINNKNENKPLESITNIVTVNNAIISDPIKIADAFNNYYIDGTKFDCNVSPNNNIKLPPNHLKSIFLRPVAVADVIKIIKMLKNTKSTGVDEITTEVIKHCADVLSVPLAFIFNLMLEKGVFPDKLKIAVVKPLFKKKDKKKLENYRPIALLSVFSKIAERIIFNQIYDFIEREHILAKEQNGFRKNKSTTTAIYQLTKTVTENVDKRIPICALYMDLSKAFDFVDHTRLLEKLERYGIRGNALDLLKSYLCNRKQCTEIKRLCKNTKEEVAYYSKFRPLRRGVPQGSILGPLLFLIYINDLPTNVQHPMILFADDSTVLIKSESLLSYNKDINNTLKNIIDWLQINRLKMNIEKTQIMQFHQSKINAINLDIKYNDECIEHTNVAKFLGLDIDNQLNWKVHTETLDKKINNFVFALRRITKSSDRKTALLAYHGYIGSILRYGIIFWGNSTNKKNVFIAQKKCIRAICSIKKTDSCKPYFKELKILTLASLYIYEVAVFVKSNPNMFPTKSINSRHKYRINTVPGKTALLRNSILGMSSRIYNFLPDVLKQLHLEKFKKKLKEELINRAYYTIDDFFKDKF
jgi:hypothetical protein